MKTKLFIFSLLLFSQKLIGQFAVVQPELFALPLSSNTPCSVSDMGKTFYDTNGDYVTYCRSENAATRANSLWEGTTAIYYMGKIGINKGIPSEEVDILGSAKFNTLSVNGRIGLNTSTPTEKLEVVNRNVFIKSTADENYWSLSAFNTGGRLDFKEVGSTRAQIINGGNLVIGGFVNTNKLNVQGNVSYAGSLLVEGKGIVANTNTTQLVMHTVTSSVTANNNILIESNTCMDLSFNLPAASFTSAPAVFLGQNLSVNQLGSNLIKSVMNVTTIGGLIRICNTTGADVTFSNQSFSLIAIGQ